jgi:hypothetical protein
LNVEKKVVCITRVKFSENISLPLGLELRWAYEEREMFVGGKDCEGASGYRVREAAKMGIFLGYGKDTLSVSSVDDGGDAEGRSIKADSRMDVE